MIISKYINNAVGVDYHIQLLQKYINKNQNLIDWCFGRAYKNENRDKKIIPELFINKDEYKEIYGIDFVKGFGFFDVAETIDILHNNSNTYYKETTVRLIIFSNLKKAFSLSYRADENLIVGFETLLQNYTNKRFKLTKIIKGLKNVYSSYNYEIKNNLNNMQPFFICAFEFNFKYNNKLIC